MMSKLKLILLIFILFLISYYFSASIQKIILRGNDAIIDNFFYAYTSLKDITEEYFHDVDEIKKLKKENNELKKYKLLYKNLESDYAHLIKLHNLKRYRYYLSTARLLSYETIGDLNKFWVSFSNVDYNKTYGLLYDDSAVGIMYLNKDKPYALSIYDEKSIISVRIGKKNIPAIVQGGKNNVYANFIIDYEKINIGDEVYTSGKDSIFIDGIYVGKIAEIIDEAGYKRAVLTDTKMLHPYSYVYVIDTN